MITLTNISKSYNKKDNVVDRLNLHINKGELVVLIGESGCGKTTTMKMINRLTEPTAGTILIDGKDIREFERKDLRRNIGYVIQHVGLFPHLTIEKNIGIVPKLVKKNKNDILHKVKDLMNMVELSYEEYADRYPKELSGGQQQRVGVARALANDPDIILMDEPFSALDPITREQLQNELIKLQNELHKTIVFVTHDIDEALKIGDRIAIMKDGAIIQYATPEELLKSPVDEFVENFVGKSRLWKTPDMIRASDIMDTNYIEINPNSSVTAAIEMMKKHNSQVLIVVEKAMNSRKKIVGLVGINRINLMDNHNRKVREIMKTDIRFAHKDTCMVDVLNLRKENNLRFTPILDDDDNLIGIITDNSILNVLSEIVPQREDY
ncbi:MAG: betaine/proline/choline family ABC transporter ATP-binding protein [Saccharofermentanales bacterium]